MSAMKQPLRLQLALQGGGAKIVHLIAALEAVEEFQNGGKIEVTRIAGASAGAIAGSLFSAGIAMEAVKAEMKILADDLDAFPALTKFRFFHRVILRNKAIAETTTLYNLLDNLFAGKNKTRIKDLGSSRASGYAGPKMLVVSADLYKGTYHVAEDEEHIVTALLDSCALPFYFRTWSHPRGMRVDGGICENLPVERLRSEQENFGPIVALSFTRSPLKDPCRFWDYAKALINTAIDNSVSRSLQTLGPEYVLSISTDIETFDFERALNEDTLRHAYNSTKKQVQIFLQQLLDSVAKKAVRIQGDLWANQNPETMRKLNVLYSTVFEKAKYKVRRAAYVVQANCLTSEGEFLFGEPDVVTYTLEFETIQEAIHAHRLSHTISSTSRFLGQAELYLWSPSELGTEHNSLLFPVANEPRKIQDIQALDKNVTEHQVRQAVVFFSPPLPANSGPFTLMFKEQLQDSMLRLKTEGEDKLWITELLRAEGAVDVMDLVILVPKSFGGILLTDPVGQADKNVGKALTAKELQPYYEKMPPGFVALGWRCLNAQPTAPFEVRILRDGRAVEVT